MIPGVERPPGRPWERPEWGERDALSRRRVQAPLTGEPLPLDDPAGFDLDVYGLDPVRTLEQWLEYAGLD